MAASRGASFGNRSVSGVGLVCALGAAGALVSSCSSSNEGVTTFPAFVPEDCRGGLVEVARFRVTATATSATARSAVNNLVLEGETLFMTYAFAATDSGLPPSGGIVAVPVAGGAARVVGAAAPEITTQWGTGSFWVSGGQIHLQTGTEIRSFGLDSPTPSTLPVESSPTQYAAFVHDAEFGYSAHGEHQLGLKVTKTPLAGGVPTVLIDQPVLPNVSLGGMADAGDALLLHVQYRTEAIHTDPGETFTSVWRIPKDGAPYSEVRTDVAWADPVVFAHWLAWDGADILGSIDVQNYVVMARVAVTGASPPEHLKLAGIVATRRGDEILSLQTLETRGAQSTTARLLVASSQGAPAGTVIACGAERSSALSGVPAGIAANDSAIYVSYKERDDTVIARVSP
jgi:hypothetical protein